jgi:hypothetical protein
MLLAARWRMETSMIPKQRSRNSGMIRAVSTAVTPLRKGPAVATRERRARLCIAVINLQMKESNSGKIQ